MHGSGEFAYALAEKGLVDERGVEGSTCSAQGTVRMELDDVKRFDSGVVPLTYLSGSDRG